MTAECRTPVTWIESKVQATFTQELSLFWGRKCIFTTYATLLIFLSSKWIGTLSFTSVKLSDVFGICDFVTSSVICLKNTETVVCLHLVEQTHVKAWGVLRMRALFPAPAVRFQQWGSSVCVELPGQLWQSPSPREAAAAQLNGSWERAVNMRCVVLMKLCCAMTCSSVTRWKVHQLPCVPKLMSAPASSSCSPCMACLSTAVREQADRRKIVLGIQHGTEPCCAWSAGFASATDLSPEYNKSLPQNQF